MSRSSLLAVTCSILACSGALGQGYSTSYFEPSVPGDPGAFVVRVEDVVERGPSAKAGILKGDIIVALDGLRIHSQTEYSAYVQCVRRSTRIEVTVWRKSELKTLVIEDVPAKASIGCRLSDRGPSIWSVLKEQWKIAPGDFLDAPAGDAKEDQPDVVDDIARAFNPDPLPSGPMARRVTWFPRKGVHALSTLAARRSEADRLWVIGLLKVYGALVNQRYADVKELVSLHGLSRSSKDPFLDELVSFYTRIAEQPPARTNGISLSVYGVDPVCFALCYPYPIIPERRTDWFGSDRKLKRDFDSATTFRADRDSAARVDAAFFANDDGSDSERYIGYMRGALVDPGYAFSASSHDVIQSPTRRAALLATLNEKLVKQPDRKVLISLALLAPSVVANDLACFKKSYQAVYDAGTRELAVANSIIDDAFDDLQQHGTRRKSGEFRDAQREITGKVSAPEIYNFLAARSSDIASYVQAGCFYLDARGIQEVGGYCIEHPDSVVRALPNTPVKVQGGEGPWWGKPALKYKKSVGTKVTAFGPHHWNRDENGKFLFCPTGLAASDVAELYSIPALMKASSAKDVSPIASGSAASLYGEGWKGGALSGKLGYILTGNGAGTTAHASLALGDSCVWSKDTTVFSITNEGATHAGIDGMAFSHDSKYLYSNIHEPPEMRNVICTWNVGALTNSGMGLTSNATFQTSMERVRNLSAYRIGGRDLIYYGEGEGGGTVCVYDPAEGKETTVIADGLKSGLTQYDIMNVKVGGVSVGKMHLYVQCGGGSLYVYDLAADGKSVGACVRFFSAAELQMILGEEWVHMRAFEVTDDETYAFFSHHPFVHQREPIQLFVVWALSSKAAAQ